MLKGCDISHWQGYDFDFSEYDFVIAKATEGMTGRDKTFAHNIDRAVIADKLIGAYHYARPENNTPLEEAYNFLAVVKPYVGKILLALDWEGEALKHDISWALEWLNIIYTETGVKPVLYCSESYVKKCGVIASAGYGLWVAKWSDNKPTVAPFQFWALWQYTSKPHDKDYFNGTKEQFMKYCISDKVEPNLSCNACAVCSLVNQYIASVELLTENLKKEMSSISGKE